jgi:predicted metal-dependent peptidase
MNAVVIESADLRLKRAHIQLMRHRETYLLAGVLMLGESRFNDDIPTAATNGRDKYYNKDFIDRLPTQAEVNFIVAHEGGHILLKHLPRHRDLTKENPKLANMAMDYALNAYLLSIKDKNLLTMPKGGLYDPMFEGWSVRQIYNYLKTGRDNEGKQRGQPQPGKDGNGNDVIRIGGKTHKCETLDAHDSEGLEQMSDEEIGELTKQIDKAVQQAALLAGAKGDEVPRSLTELLQPEINWVDVLADYVTSRVRGDEEHTFAKFNLKRMAVNLFRPTKYTERNGIVVVCIDTSGSIGDELIQRLCGELAGICDGCDPEEVHVLWWDTDVRGHQVFTGAYQNLREALKPSGGGGTHVSCVSDYIVKNNIDADCVIVFTDGYVEDDINWRINVPTLWLVTEREGFIPPAGYVVKFK